MTEDIFLSLIDESGLDGARLHLWSVGDRTGRTKTSTLLSDEARREPVLIEGSTYGYELSGTDGKLEAVIEPRELFEPDRPGASRGRLCTGNRAGILVIKAVDKVGAVFSGSIEVMSAKLRYDEEYRWMLRDITSDLAEAALSRFGATQSRYVPIDQGEPATLYQRFAFLQAVLESDEYQQALQQVLGHPYVAWECSMRRRPTSSGLRSSHATVRAVVRAGPRIRLHEPLGSLVAVPHDVPEQQLRPATDNLPNQFIKALLEEWRGLAQQVHDALVKEQGMKKTPLAPVMRGLSESNRLIDGLDAVLATQLFRGVSPLSQYPVDNQVLLRRPGYRELVRIHQQAQMAATLTWDGADLVFGAGQRDVATLYEYWVFLQVGRIVSELCGRRFDYAGLFQLSDSGLQLNLRKRRAQVVSGSVNVAGKDLHLTLWFNRPFRRVTGESWSRDMRPDLSLGIGFSAEDSPRDRVWLHFDAKYRIEHLNEIIGEDEGDDLSGATISEGEPEGRALREDLLKMHAYRDAIRRSSGAYVVYPGHGNGKTDETFLEFHELLPGLGAFALRPSEHGPVAGEAGIRRFIEDTLQHVGDILSRDRRALYWVSAVMGDPPCPARVEPITSRSVEGLWFLNRPPEDEVILLATSPRAIVWDEKHDLLIFRTDGPAQLPARVYRSRWAALLLSAEKIVLLRLEDEAVTEGVPEGIGLDSGNWLAVRAVEYDMLPKWLVASEIERLLAGTDSMLLSWGELAIRICEKGEST